MKPKIYHYEELRPQLLQIQIEIAESKRKQACSLAKELQIEEEIKELKSKMNLYLTDEAKRSYY